jgi:hypothetical protein
VTTGVVMLPVLVLIPLTVLFASLLARPIGKLAPAYAKDQVVML